MVPRFTTCGPQPRRCQSRRPARAYQDVASKPRQLVWFDRDGTQLGLVGQAGAQSSVTLASDDKRVAVVRDDPQTSNRDIWLVGLARGTRLRLTFDEAWDGYPVWSPDGGRMVFSSTCDGVHNLYHTPSSGTGRTEVLFKSNNWQNPLDWSADGRFIIYQTSGRKTLLDVWVLPLSRERER